MSSRTDPPAPDGAAEPDAGDHDSSGSGNASVEAQLEIWRLRDAVIGAEATAGELRARLTEAEHTILAMQRPVTRRNRIAGKAIGLVRRLPGSERPVNAHRGALRASRSRAPMTRSATISVLTPAYDTTVDLARRLAGSMLAQRAHWEWVVVDDASTDTSGVDEIRRQMGDDPRLKLITHDTNQGIVGATATALAHASGTFVALLDHDDELHPDALAEVTAAIEDRRRGRRDLHRRGQDRPGRPPPRAAVLQARLEPRAAALPDVPGPPAGDPPHADGAVGGFRVGYDGSQDYDLALRVTEQARRIHHIPKVLYHCRSAPRVRGGPHRHQAHSR
jgi:hypothetical protein